MPSHAFFNGLSFAYVSKYSMRLSVVIIPYCHCSSRFEIGSYASYFFIISLFFHQPAFLKQRRNPRLLLCRATACISPPLLFTAHRNLRRRIWTAAANGRSLEGQLYLYSQSETECLNIDAIANDLL